MAPSSPTNQAGIDPLPADVEGVTSEELLVPLSVPAMLRNTVDESCFGPVAYSSDEAHFPASRLVKISCKMMFGVMLADLGLPNARYSSYVHEDGEVSAVITFYSPSRFVGEGLEQLKIGGSVAATSEIAEDSAAREGIRHIEVSEDVKIEDLHYTELTSVMKSYKKLLWKSMKKRKERENFEKQLSASVKRMAGSSRNIVSLISDSRSLGQGSEAVYHNEALARIEVVANELSEVAEEMKRKLKRCKNLQLVPHCLIFLDLEHESKKLFNVHPHTVCAFVLYYLYVCSQAITFGF